MKTVSINPDHVSNSPPDFEFEELLLESIDDGLSILGDSTKQAVYVCLQKTYGIKKQDIPNKIQRFTHAIEQIFGPGAKLLQIQIMKQLYQRIGHAFEYFPENGELLFLEYVDAVEASYVQARTQNRPVPLRLF